MTELDAHLRPDDDQHRIIKLIIASGAERHLGLEGWLSQEIIPDFSNPQIRELLPSLYLELLQHQPSHATLTLIRPIYIAFMARTTQQRKLWANLLHSLNTAGVEPVMLKGVSVVDTYYSNPVDRPMADADILVTLEEQTKTHEILLSLGWVQAKDTVDMLDARFEHAAAYVHKKFPFGSVDLHTHVMSKYPILSIDQWYLSRIESCSYENVTANRLNPTALLTHTILHGLRWERQTPIKWIIDATRICQARGAEIDWEAIVSFGREHQVLNRLSLGLEYLNQEFQVQVPVHILRELKNYEPGWFERFENNYLLTASAHLLTGFASIWHLIRFIVWRAMRMGSIFRLPINIWLVCFHMVGSDGVSSIRKRLIRFATRNK